jgi:predicted pyridoxine 5'-phosphate oxidase superfamily flavin-nucleotide-binding protein
MNLSQNSSQASVFHEGEKSFHKALGIEERMDEMGKRMMRDHMPDQHRDFFAQLPMIHICVLDENGHPSAILRTGNPGFISSPDEYTLIIDSQPLAGEPENLQLTKGSKISIVGVEFATRRRNRLNATILSHQDNKLEMRVDLSFGNCPKYIQIRNMFPPEQLDLNSEVFRSDNLGKTERKIITAVDTLFIASRSSVINDEPKNGIDINHRGGNPGFIEIIDDQTIQFPDYLGNNMFNTFGNIVSDPRVAIQLIDFENKTLMHIQGRAEIITLEGKFDGNPDMGRRVKIRIENITITTDALPFKPEFISWSPMLPGR